MSDKQTTALILLVIIAILFFLYNNNRLAAVVSAANGSSVPTSSQNTSNNLTGLNKASIIASDGNSLQSSGGESGLAGDLATAASLGTALAAFS